MTLPTLVIGIGMGGIKTVQTFSDVVREKGQQKYYEFIAIDSNRKDLDEKITHGQGIQTVPIDETGYAIREMINKCNYLYDGVAPSGGGAIRDRIYARFLFDLNSERVSSAITGAMTKLKTVWQEERETQNRRVLVWVIHTLGGGTGSGAFPSLIATVRELAEGIFSEAHIHPIIWCIGILPSATNINDISTAKFDKKYPANSFAALREIQLLSNPPKGLNIPTFNSYPKKDIAIPQRPFDRYFLFGIDEDAIIRLRDGHSDEAEEYLDDVNHQIAYMMYYLPFYPNGIENLWHNKKEYPFVIFGESEITIPLENLKKYAAESDALGIAPDKEKKKVLDKHAADLISLPTDDLNETRIDSDCLSVVGSDRLRCFNYFIGQVQHECDKAYSVIETHFTDDIQNFWEGLKRLDWAYDKIKNYDDENVQSKYQRIVQVVEERIEDNKKFIDSIKNLPRVIERSKRSEQNINNGIKLAKLREQYDRYIKMQRLKRFLENDIGEKFEQYTGTKERGVGNIAHHIRVRENRLVSLGEKLTDSGVGRVVTLGVPLEKVENLTLSEAGRTDVSGINYMPEFIEKLSIDDAKIEDLFRNRIELASNYTIKVAVGLGNNHTARRPGDEIHIFCQKQNEPILAKFSNLLSPYILEKVTLGSIDSGTIAFLRFQVGIEIEDTKDFNYRQKEYLNGDLAKIIDLENIGIIFAYPEWFPEDESVRLAYPALFPSK